MKSKKERLIAIIDIVKNNPVNNQEDLLILLKKQGFDTTQATLSRDIKELKIIKSPDTDGKYKYIVSSITAANNRSSVPGELTTGGFISLEFSNQLAVIKTRPGYAMAIASDIDNRISHTILGTIAGDDTILLIPKEGFGKEEVTEALTQLFPKSALIRE